MKFRILQLIFFVIYLFETTYLLSQTTITTALKLPRITTAERNKIDVSGVASHGITIYNTDIGCIEYWNSIEWESLCGELKPAIFSIGDCANINIHGKYFTEQVLIYDNYITIPVNVQTKGSYSIVFIPSPENGYYFATSGEFLTTGNINVVVPGFGTPVNYTPIGQNGDLLKITINETDVNCANNVYVKIKDGSIKPNFGVSCKTIDVHGNYRKNKVLDATNYITLKIEVQSGSAGAEWIAETNTIDGFKFYGSGILGQPGQQEITLYGEGVPLTSNVKEFTLTTNSETTATTCTVNVIPMMSQKKIVEFAQNAGQDYGLASSNTSTGGPKDMLFDKMNFGNDMNSIIYYDGFNAIDHVSATSVTKSTLQNYTQGTNPYDIIIFTYNARPSNQDAINELVDYINKGGVVIHLDQSSSSNNTDVIKTVFGMTGSLSSSSLGSNAHQVLKITSTVNDDITNGPFGDVRGKQWGEDFDNTRGITDLPAGAIVYSAAVDASTGNTPSSLSNIKATMLRHPSKSYLWCGDSGLINGSYGSSTTGPFRAGAISLNGISYPYYPIDKQNYGSGSVGMPVCNSTIFANIMAWALKMADENGINNY